MNFHFSTKLWVPLTVFLTAVILLLAALSGIKSGKSLAQGNLIAGNAQELAKGFKYFYNDYSRYPTALEFQNQDLMKNYFNIFPPENLAADTCDDNFVYKRIAGSSYQLNFCLPSGVGGYKSGWNMLNGNSK